MVDVAVKLVMVGLWLLVVGTLALWIIVKEEVVGGSTNLDHTSGEKNDEV
tara:strand:+ start:3215 stop:3364 length:150 start_codon:yes stop_codon:yes gene_type:complete